MKKIIIICLLLQICTNTFAQDKEPSAWHFKYESPSQTPTTFDPNFFTKDKLLFGFQWSASKNMNDAPVPIFGYLHSSQHFFNECNDEYRTVLYSNVKLIYMEVS